MPKKNGYQDLYIWTESKSLFIQLYSIFNPKKCKDYFLRDQILRACLSISNNIAEGYERFSPKQEKLFFKYARGSCGEVKNMIIIAYEIGFISHTEKISFQESLNKISAGLYKRIQKK